MKTITNPLLFVPAGIFLVMLLFIPREHHYLLKAGLLVALLPLIYTEMRTLKKEDKENGTKIFNQRLMFMGVILVTLTVYYIFAKI